MAGRCRSDIELSDIAIMSPIIRLDFFFRMIREKEWDLTSQLLESFPFLSNERDVKGLSPLNIALVNGAPFNLIYKLLSTMSGTEISSEINYILIALHHNASLDTLILLMDAFPHHVMKRNDRMELPLHVAASNVSSFSIIASLLFVFPDGSKSANTDGYLPLHLAIAHSASIYIILLLLKAYPISSSHRIKNGFVALHLSILLKSDIIVIAALLDSYMIATKCKDRDGNIPLFTALLHHANVGVIRLLLEADPASLEERNLDFDLAIHVAIKSECCFEIVKLLIDERPSCVSVANCDGDLPIHTACSIGSSLELIRYLCDTFPEGARVCNYGDNLPLHLAVSSGASIEVVDMLLRLHIAGAAHKNSMDKVPLLLAIEARAEAEVVAALLKANPAEAGQRDHKDALPLHNAVSKNVSTAAFRAIYDICPLAISEGNEDKDFPLHKAATGICSIDLLRVVIQACPEALMIKNRQGDLPLHIAACSTKVSLEKLQEIVVGNPSAARVGNDASNYLPVVCALKRRAPADIISVLLAAYPLAVKELCVKEGKVHLIYSYSDSVYELLSFAATLLRRTKKYGVHRLHICGPSGSGKSSLSLRLQRSLGSIFSSFGEYHVRKSFQNEFRCPLMQKAVTRNASKWLFMDYSGERELLSVCSSFLSLSDSVFIVVVPLWDIVCNKLVNFDQAIADCRFWLRLLNSVARKGSKCYIVRNFKRLGYAADRAYCKRIKDAIKQLISDFNCRENRDLTFAYCNLKSYYFKSSRSPHASLQSHAWIDRTTLESYAATDAVRIVKDSWPKAAEKMTLLRSYFIPLIESNCSLKNSFQDCIDLNIDYERCLFRVYDGVFDRVLNRLTAFGELLVIDGIGDSWVVTDQNWLMGDVLGGLHRHKTSDEVQFIDGEHCSCSYVLTAQDIESRCHGSTYFNGDIYLLPKLLEFLGYCVVLRNREGSDIRILYRIDCTGNPDSSTLNMYCFPCFCVATMPLERRFISSKAWHHLHTRRYKLKAPNYQMFPPGYFPSLFVQICQAVSYLCCGIVQVWADGLEIRCEDSGNETACIRVAIMQDETMFEIEIGYRETAEFLSLADAIYDLVTHPKGRRACWENVKVDEYRENVENRSLLGSDTSFSDEKTPGNELFFAIEDKESSKYQWSRMSASRYCNNPLSERFSSNTTFESYCLEEVSAKMLDCGSIDCCEIPRNRVDREIIDLERIVDLQFSIGNFGKSSELTNIELQYHTAVDDAMTNLQEAQVIFEFSLAIRSKTDSASRLMTDCRNIFDSCKAVSSVYIDLPRQQSSELIIHCSCAAPNHLINVLDVIDNVEDFTPVIMLADGLKLCIDEPEGHYVQKAQTLAELHTHANLVRSTFREMISHLAASSHVGVNCHQNMLFKGQYLVSSFHSNFPYTSYDSIKTVTFRDLDYVKSSTYSEKRDSVFIKAVEDAYVTDNSEFERHACLQQWDIVLGIIVARTAEQLCGVLGRLTRSPIIRIIQLSNKVSIRQKFINCQTYFYPLFSQNIRLYPVLWTCKFISTSWMILMSIYVNFI